MNKKTLTNIIFSLGLIISSISAMDRPNIDSTESTGQISAEIKSIILLSDSHNEFIISHSDDGLNITTINLENGQHKIWLKLSNGSSDYQLIRIY